MMQLKRGYYVYRNDKYLKFVEGRNREIRKRVALEVVGQHTHMGEWMRTPSGTYEYATTIGVYVKLVPTTRYADSVE